MVNLRVKGQTIATPLLSKRHHSICLVILNCLPDSSPARLFTHRFSKGDMHTLARKERIDTGSRARPIKRSGVQILDSRVWDLRCSRVARIVERC
jgi:hypothetical protein